LRKKDLLQHNADETIVAISTPVGEGGIGIVRLSGKNALSIADKIFVSKDKIKPSKFKTYTTHYGHIARGETIDEVILTVMRAPKSYTKEDVVEVNCHGGIVPLRKVLNLVVDLGARLAEPGEFTKRAFLNGRIDLTQAEAVLDIIKSRTEGSMKVALGQLEGELSLKIKSMKRKLLDILSETEARIDFSEEDIELRSQDEIKKKLKNISEELKKLIDDTWKGLILKEGIMCVICGKPNVGKSSLMNVLLKRNRVIVTPVPGTTRDAIEEMINLGGIPLKIVDTAGISRAKDIVEEHGIRKSKSYIKKADLILFMLDMDRPWSNADKDIFKDIKGTNFLVIVNKSDLKRKLSEKQIKKIAKADKIIEISLLRKRNLDKLEKAILQEIWHGNVPQPEGIFVANLRHKKDLENTRSCINMGIKILRNSKEAAPEVVSSFLRDAIFSLGSILGESVEPDILGRIFSKFCIGK